jgi:general secretion pathway protein D
MKQRVASTSAGADVGLAGAPPRRPLAAMVAVAVACTSLPAPMAFAQAQQSAAQRQPSRFQGEPVTLNFVNADIEGVSRAMGAILKQQFVVDPRVKGNITLFSETPLTPREAYLNFLASLRGLGFTVVEVGGLFKVVPEADAKLQSGTVSVGAVERRGDQVITQIFRLTHENANNLVPVLRPLISPNNTINANPGNNTLVITDYADNLQRIGKIIAAMDTASAGDVEIFTLKYAVANDLAPMVQRLSDAAPVTGGAPAQAAGGGATGGAPSILIDSRSNSLIVRAPNAARMATIRGVIEKLDQPSRGGDNPMGNIYVVYLKNAEAVRLAAVLRAAYAAGVPTATGALGGAAGGGGGSSTTPNAPIINTSQSNASGGSAAATTPVQGAAAPSTGGMIQADPASNSLIITAPEPVYRQLRAVIDQLDSRRAQVYIESMIVEVKGDNAAEFGFQWQGIGSKDNNVPFAGTNFGTTGNILNLSAGISQGNTDDGRAAVAAAGISQGLNIGLLHKFGSVYGLAAIAKVLQSQTNTNIVSTPNLITLDNEEAKIIVGSNVPFITGSYAGSAGTASTNPFTTVERKDVGITLRIRPQIGENGTVRMVIYQESSSLSSQVAPGTTNAGPTTDKRAIESTVIVDDGQIIVLGGLIEDKFQDIKSKVPLLGDIPFIGALFRSESRQKTRTNLMVFLRPIVMRDAATANKLSLDRYDLIRAQQRDAQPAPSWVMPINESPVVPPLGVLETTEKPLAITPASPARGVAPNTLPNTPPTPNVTGPTPTPAEPVTAPVPAPAAPTP